MNDKPLTWKQLTQIGKAIAIRQAQQALGPATAESYAAWIAELLRCEVNRNMVISSASRNDITLELKTGRPRPCGSTGSFWSDKEVRRLLKLYYLKTSERDIAKDLGRTAASVRHKRRVLGLSPKPADKGLWTKDESAYALSLKGEGMTAREIGQVIGRTANAVENKFGRTQPKRRASVSYDVDQSRAKQEQACQDELRALIREHRWFAEKLYMGQGVNGLPEWPKQTTPE